MGTAPVLFTVMFGGCDEGVFVSETRGLYKYILTLCAVELSERFDLVKEGGTRQHVFSSCVCVGFELRIMRDNAIYAHVEIESEMRVVTNEKLKGKNEKWEEERFRELGVSYVIDGVTVKNIYGATLKVRKKSDSGVKTVIEIHRVLKEDDLPSVIEDMTITARLFRDCYEERRVGTFSIHLSKLFLMGDETNIDCMDAVIGVVSYFVTGDVNAEIFTEGNNDLL
jgi:hypothetical protein